MDGNPWSRYGALATDYDGTLARDGRVDDSTCEALRRFRATGRRLILVTGRELEELLGVFQEVHLFDRVVAENGPLLYRPEIGTVRAYAEPLPESFVEALRSRGVAPISIGRVVVATWKPHEAAVLETMREMGLGLDLILNKRAVMVLPTGVDKAFGLAIALEDLGISPADVVGIGDAENDLTFLAGCGRAVAVANALPSVKSQAHLVTEGGQGQGVIELIGRILGDP